jgi:hypothetical protein
MYVVTTPLWAKCEDETHTPKSGNLESSGTPKNSELDCRGQNTLHWGVLDIIGKVLKCRCSKWPRMSHLDICSLSYGQKKGRESNWQFDSRPQKVENRPDPDVHRVNEREVGALLMPLLMLQCSLGLASCVVDRLRRCPSPQFLTEISRASISLKTTSNV